MERTYTLEKQQFKFDYSNTRLFITEDELEQIKSEIIKAHEILITKTGSGNDFLGWLELPYFDKKLITKIKKIAQQVIDSSDAFVSIGIGGSYLGARAIIEAIPLIRDGFSVLSV